MIGSTTWLSRSGMILNGKRRKRREWVNTPENEGFHPKRVHERRGFSSKHWWDKEENEKPRRTVGKQLPKAGDFYIFLPSRIQPYVAMVTFKNLKPLHQDRPGAELTHGYVARQTCRTHPRTQQKNRILSQIDGFQLTKTLGFSNQTLPFSFHFMVQTVIYIYIYIYIEAAHGVNVNQLQKWCFFQWQGFF